MRNIYLGYETTREDWRDLIDQLRGIEGLTILSIPERDNDGLFTHWEFVSVEYNGQFFYIQRETYKTCFQVVPHVKISPWKKAQADYPHDFNHSLDLLKFILTCKRYPEPLRYKSGRKFETCPVQSLYWDYSFRKDLLMNLLGNREKEIFNDLSKIENIITTKDYCVLRFWSKSGDYFDYECKSNRITS